MVNIISSIQFNLHSSFSPFHLQYLKDTQPFIPNHTQLLKQCLTELSYHRHSYQHNTIKNRFLNKQTNYTLTIRFLSLFLGELGRVGGSSSITS